MKHLSRTEADNLFVGVPCTGAAALVPEAALLPLAAHRQLVPGLCCAGRT